MAEFDVSIPQINTASAIIGAAQKDLGLIQQTMRESLEQARSAWICGTADSFFGQLAKAVDNFDDVIDFAARVKGLLDNASGNYSSNEKVEVSITKQIQDAYNK
ncbi:hypothetical protein [Aristaeella hokkaidonensis]|uniref:Uncharacterized protein n=1 Tax=Aristaeella hokkaidonensis TaxID=3046382 RepID=A0AC61N492_9FIRM|nr:hypothetical protein [Aristaeella hokkaidonensis]QUC66376.1 hypothetical protein JYE49_10965 [Aristaeella hokkaidonensis]SNT94213.1 hypothetical protein SAMN06297421_104185 [Aristaeella hokkaidonensis]